MPIIFLVIIEYKDTSKIKKFLKLLLILNAIVILIEYFLLNFIYQITS